MKKDEKIEQKSLQLLSTFKSVDEEEMKVFNVVGSDDSVDRHGDRINPKGWDLENFKKNPVIMLNHDYSQFPIGKALNVKRKNNALVFDIQFSKTLPLAKEAFDLVKEGIMKAWSVGFLVKEWATSGSEYTIDKMELLELSLVAIPANPNALLNSLNKDQRKMVKAFNELLKSLEITPKSEEKAENEASDEVVNPEVEENKPEEAENEAKPEEEAEEDEPEVKPEEKKEEEKAGEEKETELKEEKILEKLLQSNELKILIDNAVKEAVVKELGLKVKEVESDEEEATDPQLLLLNSIREELKKVNKDSGKTLKSFNELLSTIK